MKNLLSKSKSIATNTSITGKSFAIRFMPDPFTQEVMNIGVGFIEHDGTLHTKMLSSFHRLNCLYDDRITEGDIKYMLTMLEASLPSKINSDVIPSPSINISYSPTSYTSGASIDDILNMLFDDSVTLAIPFKENERTRIAGLDTNTVRSRTFSILREELKLKADSIIAQNPNFHVEIDGTSHYVDVPLQGDRKLGTVISACQSLQTVRNSINDCANNLRTAQSVHKNDDLRCFIMRSEKEARSRRLELDAYFDKIDWMMSAQGIPMVFGHSPEEVACHIREWQ